MKKRIIYLHIGYGKTGSTFLQEKFFNNLNINYLGKNETNYPQWLIDLHYLDDFYFHQRINTIKDSIKDISTAKVNLLSSEAFLIAGGWYQQFNRIKEVFTDFKVKIIITLREPVDAILSFYKYNVAQKNILTSLKNSIDFTRTPYACFKRKPIYLPDYYYSEVVETYMQEFGKDNVLILRYEDLKSDSTCYFEKITNFLNIDLEETPSINIEKVNSSPSLRKTEELRVNNINEFLQENFSPDLNLHEVDEELQYISEDLKNKLISFLQGKCFGYY